MLDPIRLTTDLFKEKNLSDVNLRTFSENFLVRLANADNNPGGIYNQLLVETTTKHQNYYGTILSQVTKEAVGKGLTISMNQAHAAVISKLSGLQGLVKYKFGKGSEEYKEFYPQGMKQYHHAAIGSVGLLLIRFLAIAEKNLQAAYPAEVAQLALLIENFREAREAQQTNFGVVDHIATGRHEQRKALTLQLTKSFLRIASDTLENPDKFHDYYEARYLPIRKAKKKVVN